MAIKVISIGSTKDDFLRQSVQQFLTRLGKYAIVQWIELPDVKKKLFKTSIELKKLEAQIILNEVKPNTFLVGLDENGKQTSSRGFAELVNQWTSSHADVAFVVGGAFGFDEQVYNRMNAKLSLSKMTLSHQMIRLLFVEQLYRAYSILHGEPYHND